MRHAYRRGAETPREELDRLSASVIGRAIEVHKALGPGLLESVYEECLAFELTQAGVPFRRQAVLPVVYKGRELLTGYQMDLVVSDALVVELKTVDRILPVHEAQLLTYLKLSGLRLGLLINFKVQILRDGIQRMVLNY